MSIETFLTFLLASCVISLTPGPGAVNTLSNGILYGVRGTIPAIAGLQAGLMASTLMVGIGLGAIIASSVFLYTLIKWIGVAYLIYLGYRKWCSHDQLEIDSTGQRKSGARQKFQQATLVNLTNPKAIVFLIALFPQFVDPAAPQVLQFAILGGTMIVVDTCVMLGYASLAARLRNWVTSPRAAKIQNRIFGGLFMGAGVLIATSAKSSTA